MKMRVRRKACQRAMRFRVFARLKVRRRVIAWNLTRHALRAWSESLSADMQMSREAEEAWLSCLRYGFGWMRVTAG